MLKTLSITVALCGFCLHANADVWRWTDANGQVHYVNSNTPIYTWQDETGKIYYADTPENVSAVRVELVWYSTDTVAAVTADEAAAAKSGRSNGLLGETAADRTEREQAEAYYCKQLTEIRNSYLSAPQLYETDADGERVYLDKQQAAAKIAEAEAALAQVCN